MIICSLNILSLDVSKIIVLDVPGHIICFFLVFQLTRCSTFNKALASCDHT